MPDLANGKGRPLFEMLPAAVPPERKPEKVDLLAVNKVSVIRLERECRRELPRTGQDRDVHVAPSHANDVDIDCLPLVLMHDGDAVRGGYVGENMPSRHKVLSSSIINRKCGALRAGQSNVEHPLSHVCSDHLLPSGAGA